MFSIHTPYYYVLDLKTIYILYNILCDLTNTINYVVNVTFLLYFN